jgi:hypothetical protein
MLVTVCKTQTKNYFDEDNNIKEKTTLILNFTIDYRFVDPYLIENFNKDIKNIGENPEVFDSEMNKLIEYDNKKTQ